MKRVVVVGLGSFGRSAARTLGALGYEVIALDKDEGKVEGVSQVVTKAMSGDGTDRRVLEAIGASGADAGIVSTGRDITSSLLTCLALRDAGVKDVYVKVISHLHRRIVEEIGVRETVFPEPESAERLVRRITSPGILNYVELGPGLSAQEFGVPASWVGQSLRQLELPRRFGVSVIAVRDYLSGEVTPVPDPDSLLKDSDTLLVAGRDDRLARLMKAG